MAVYSEKEKQYLDCLGRKNHDDKVYKICGRIMLIYTFFIAFSNILYIIIATMNMVLNSSVIKAAILLDEEVNIPMVGFLQIVILFVGFLFFAAVFFASNMRVGWVSLALSVVSGILSVSSLVCAVVSESGGNVYISLVVYCGVVSYCSFLETIASRDIEDLKKYAGYPEFNMCFIEEDESEFEYKKPKDEMTPDERLMLGRDGNYKSGRE